MALAIPAPSPARDSADRWFRRVGPRVVVGSAVGAALLSALFFTPRYWLWCFAGASLSDVVAIQPEFNRAFFALQQLQAPWQPVDNLTHRVIEWRLFFPVAAHYLGIPGPLFLALPPLGCLGTLIAAAGWMWRATRDPLFTATATLLAATASWYFVSTGWLAYFDSWLLLALLAASFARSRWLLLVAALVAPWIDERFLLALPLCLGVRMLAFKGEQRGQGWRDTGWLIAGTLPYVATRLGVEWQHVRTTSGSYWSEHAPFAAPAAGIFLGVWHGLRLGWVAVCFALAAALRRRQMLALLGILAGIVINLGVADDLSRSASVAVPVLLVGLWRYWQADASRARRLLALMCAGNLLLPAAHIMATPRSAVEAYHRAPILYLYAEIEHAGNPPDFASPAAYTRRGMEALKAGRLDDAGRQFELALRYDSDFPRARAHRGILLYVRGQQAAGMVELDHALRRAPDLFDVRLQRASFRQELGDLAGARTDVAEALRGMPADWPQRAQAAEFARRLAAPSGASR